MTCLDEEKAEIFSVEAQEESFSKPSAPVVSMNLPKVLGLKSEFVYNYYVEDERTNENPKVPDYLIRKSVEQIDTKNVDFSIRVPRYIKLSWQLPQGTIAPNGPLVENSPQTSIKANLDKIQTEESFLKSKFSSHSVSSFDPIANANFQITQIDTNVNLPELSNDSGEFSTVDTRPSEFDPKVGISLTRPSSNSNRDLLKSNTFLSSLTGKPKVISSTNYRQIKDYSGINIPSSYSEAARKGKVQLSGQKKLGFSLSTMVDKFNIDLLGNYTSTNNQTKIDIKNKDIIRAVKSIEDIINSSLKYNATSFYDSNKKLIASKLGYENLRDISEKYPLNLQINRLTAIDIFASSSNVTTSDLKKINKSYISANKIPFDIDDVTSEPVYVGPVIENPDSFNSSAGLIGYLIERYIYEGEGYKYEKTFTLESPFINDFIDTTIKFGKAYNYSIRSILRVVTTGYDEEYDEIREIAYYIGSKPTETTIKTFEYVPPPHPVDLNFTWDYRAKKLQINWGMPVNSQRDIKQFQVFRRESIEEPFELISQKCFDNSNLKYKTGESIDGNLKGLSLTDYELIEYSEDPVMFHVDNDFVIDQVSLKSSKYIYSIVSIDAHGMTSNYGSQFEVTFDFFKNMLVKKLISSPGAPKPYPNLYVRIDAFKDVIKTSGNSSTKLKVYFVPEYFKIEYNDGRIQRMVSTKQDNSYYKIQFINLQNQKSDSLKITIDDPKEMTK